MRFPMMRTVGGEPHSPTDRPEATRGVLEWLEETGRALAEAEDANRVLDALLRAATDMGAARPRAGLWLEAENGYAMVAPGADGAVAPCGTAPASLYAAGTGAGVFLLDTPRGPAGVLDAGRDLSDEARPALRLLALQAAPLLVTLGRPSTAAPEAAPDLDSWWDAPDTEALLRLALEDVARLCGADSSAVVLPHPHSGTARVLFLEDLAGARGDLPWRGLNDERRNAEAMMRVLGAGEPMAFRRNPSTEALKFGMLPSGPLEGSWSAVPLSDAEGPLGVLDIQSDAPRRFAEEQDRILGRAARLLTRLLRRMGHDSRRATAGLRNDVLLETVARLAEETDAKRMAVALAAATRRLFREVDLAYVMLPQREGGLWSIAAMESMEPENRRQGWARAGEGFAGWVIQTGQTLCVSSAADDPRRGALEGGLGIRAGLWVPMRRGETLLGLLAVGSTRTERRFDADDAEALTSLAAQGAVALERARERHAVQESFWDAIEAISGAIDARDGYTHGHSRNVTEYAVAIANRMGLPPREVQTLRASALLHDIGKIGVPDHILNKPGNLTPDERTVMESHPEVGYQILLRAPSLQALLPGVRYHHERPDGKGYPCKLSGDALPLQARIMAVADAFDAMTSDRVYRKRMTVEKATSILREGRGSQWDPECVDHFLALVESRATPRLQLLAAEDSGRQYLPSLGVDVFGS